ncbi:MAG: hypothetical protein VXW14_03450 [Candidatus Thermoplasmatota archaeon]|nr:hypothetical protein [Candidatus Thermoplasmatota archaeon]MEC7253923.1 hypothetical protein [Candidatus Thermoplasmatota archaeon]
MSNADSVSDPVKPPSSVVISNPSEHEGPKQGSNQQPEEILIQAPKFNHPSRKISSILTALAIFIFLISFFNFNSSTGYGAFTHLEFGFQSCCLLFNVAFISEIVYYSKLIEYNKSHGVDIAWPVLNQLLALAFTGIGLLIFITNFL